MTGVERIERALRFEKTDRVPVIPELIQHNLNVAGRKHGEFSTVPEVMAEVIFAGQEEYETDAVYISSDNYLIAEAMGGVVKIPEDEPPGLLKRPAETIEEALRLKPLNVKDGRIPVILEATEICRKKLQDSIYVKTCIDSAPFTAAAGVLGPQEWLFTLVDEPECSHNLLRICTESVIRYGCAAAEAGAHGLAFGDSTAALVGAELYREFALPYVQQVIEELHKKTGLPVFYHVCGNTKHILEDMVKTGADCIEIDSMVPMDFAKEKAWGKCAVEGNVSTIKSFLEGTPKDVKSEAYNILDVFGNRGGLILSSACEIPRFSPKENVRALTDAAREYPYE